ncbi:beta-ketoacyl synthase N-terminal-like domain-containing protein [Streptomyces sp. KL116D]|uniref:beta-ketoacyl synthase N-terminal-like domain-containing protein n=1 Tax=Streptomyces sp. KL116D TaxID=3045152 RepID=UPI003556326F
MDPQQRQLLETTWRRWNGRASTRPRLRGHGDRGFSPASTPSTTARGWAARRRRRRGFALTGAYDSVAAGRVAYDWVSKARRSPPTRRARRPWSRSTRPYSPCGQGRRRMALAGA